MNLLFLFPFKSFSQQAEVVKFPFIESLLNNKSDTTYIINFWATWCKPCVKEMPHFEKLNSLYSDKKIKVILVSLDFKRQLETNLIPYLNKNKIQSKVVLLDEPDYNLWIDKVDKSWGGAIPATLVINSSKNQRIFYEKDFTFEELEKIIKQYIN